MTPRFAEAVDPILLHVFSLLERIDSGATISPSEEKRNLEGLLRQADARLAAQSATWEPAKYAIVAWIDEMLVDAHIWNGQDWWRENVLEWSQFKTRRCNDLYYMNANSALNLGADDALQMIYVCVMLGFRGLYRDPRVNRGLIDKHGLAADLPTWGGEFATIVRQARERWSEATASQKCERAVRTALPLWTRSQIVWPWLLATILAGLNILLFFLHS
jgi:type VI secretion system protein ImpK